jgi:uncharacterized protein YecE (DUF72 family)
MKIFVGTSGWAYGWNEGGNFDWFIKNSRLNAVELNMSFYRFPFPNLVNAWARKGSSLRWAIKVNRLVTHVFKFNERAWNAWRKFEKLFDPLKSNIDFFLFQLPPSAKPSFAEKVEEFYKRTGLGERFALEWRNVNWFKEEWLGWASKLGLTLVSLDSPDFPRDIFKTSESVYLRMHGRYAWYSHFYSREELEEVVKKIKEAKPERAYVFFNNDHAMLANAREMLSLARLI